MEELKNRQADIAEMNRKAKRDMEVFAAFVVSMIKKYGLDVLDEIEAEEKAATGPVSALDAENLNDRN